MPKQRKNKDGVLERQCSRCHEWWPADQEFFYSSKRNGLHSWCKACVLEVKAVSRRKKLKPLGCNT